MDFSKQDASKQRCGSKKKKKKKTGGWRIFTKLGSLKFRRPDGLI